MALNAAGVAKYLESYISEYRKEFERITSVIDSTPQFPKLRFSPYVGKGTLDVWVGSTGVAVISTEDPPEHAWPIYGPVFVADFADSRTPRDINERIRVAAVGGRPVGVYRMVPPGGIKAHIWNGELPSAVETFVFNIDHLTVRIVQTHINLLQIIEHLTYGIFDSILAPHIPGPLATFWKPYIFRRFGVTTADRKHQRFFNYLEISSDTDIGAWDVRNIPVRVQHDVRRDFVSAVAFISQGENAGLLSFGSYATPIESAFFDRLQGLLTSIERLRNLLETEPDCHEQKVHELLMENSVLLDVYAEAISKPQFRYPESDDSFQKSHVEPDFILRYPDRTYKLVELERPGKLVATKQGQPRSEFVQAAFQIAEWREYIAHYYHLVKERFPGISAQTPGLVIISRNTTRHFAGRTDFTRWKEILRHQYPTTDFLTYDDLIERANAAHVRLSAIH